MSVSDGLERLLASFASGTLVRPAHTQPNLVDLARAVVHLGTGPASQAPYPGASRILKTVQPNGHLVLVLADGLGLNALERLPASSFLRQHLAMELLTVYPSTTAVALTSLATAAWAGIHGITGWWTHMPEAGGAVAPLPYIDRARGKTALVNPQAAFPAPSRWTGFSVDTVSVLPKGLVGTVFSHYFSGNGRAVSYRTLPEAMALAAEHVLSAAGPTFTYLYWPEIDERAHRHGASWEELGGPVRELDQACEELAARLAGRARIVLTSDHGFVDTPRDQRHLIGAADPLMKLLASPPSGDARVLYLHARAGADQQIGEYFRSRFGDLFYVLSRDAAADLGLFGPDGLSRTAAARFGTHLAIARPPAVIEYRPAGEPLRILSQAAHHSGLSPEEMRIPLVVA
jgi:hypothetical protein